MFKKQDCDHGVAAAGILRGRGRTIRISSRLHPTYPYIVYNDLPKLDALKKEWPELLKKTGTK